jgi:hypothetical protein
MVYHWLNGIRLSFFYKTQSLSINILINYIMRGFLMTNNVKTYAIVDQDNNVVNTILWDGDTKGWNPPDSHSAIQLPDDHNVSIGHTYDPDNKTFAKAVK